MSNDFNLYVNDLAVGISRFSYLYQEISKFQSGLDELVKWGIQSLLEIFRAKGLFVRNGIRYKLSDIYTVLDVSEKQKPIMNSFLELIFKYGFVDIANGDSYQLRKEHRLILPTQLGEIVNRFPEAIINADVLQKILFSSLGLLAGKVNLLTVLFPEGSFEIVEALYSKNPDAVYFNNLVAEAIYLFAKKKVFETKESISIMEIGAGVGATSEIILNRLNEKKLCSFYHYTDISKAFVNYGKQKFYSQYNFMEFSIFNIHETISIPKRYDVLVATNVLHISRNIEVTLKQLKSLLNPGGIIVINEGVRKRDYSTIIFGFTGDWWAFSDSTLRIPGSPLLESSTWKKLLKLSGFKEIVSLNELCLHGSDFLFQDVIVATV
jgi:ubiquinone/menaquinone biosynthesis C-methylase UbiE